MKLTFEKNKDGEFIVKVEKRNFGTNDYIQMVKDIRNGKIIEAEYVGDITAEEKESVRTMLDKINKININKIENEEVEEIKVEDIPF